MRWPFRGSWLLVPRGDNSGSRRFRMCGGTLCPVSTFHAFRSGWFFVATHRTYRIFRSSNTSQPTWHGRSGKRSEGLSWVMSATLSMPTCSLISKRMMMVCTTWGGGRSGVQTSDMDADWSNLVAKGIHLLRNAALLLAHLGVREQAGAQRRRLFPLE